MGFMMQIRPEVLKKLREDYLPGAKVELIEMCDPYRDMPAGMHEEVMFVDDAGGNPWDRPHPQNRLKIGREAVAFGRLLLILVGHGLPSMCQRS